MNDGGPAFPLPHVVADANHPHFKLGHPGTAAPSIAYQYADAMLKAREEKP